MTDKKEGPAKDAGPLGESPKRPHATLDLKATEVREQPQAKPAAEPAAKPGMTPAASGAEAKPSDARPADSRTAPKSPEISKPVSPASGAKPAAAAKPVKAASSASRQGALLTHLVAGLAGGALVIAATSWMGPENSGSSETARLKVTTAVLDGRLGALENATDETAPVAELRQKIGDAESRLAKLEEIGRSMSALGEVQTKLASDTKSLTETLAREGAGPNGRDRIAKLEERWQMLAASAAAEPDGGRIPQLAAITEKITNLETALSDQPATLRKSVVDEIEGRLQQVSEASEAAKAGGERVDRDLAAVRTDAARLGQRIETLKADTDRLTATSRVMQEESGTLASAFNQLKGTVEAQLKGVARPADVSAAVFPVASKLTALEQSLESLVKSEEDRKSNAERIVLSLELANLKRVLDGGQSYAAELAAVRKASGGRMDFAALERYKEAGVPTEGDLERDFRPVMHAVIDADTEPADGSVVERLIAGAKSVVRVRKVSHSVDDKSAEAVVARMEGALKEGRLADVIEQSRAIPQRASAPMQEWLQKVAARNAVDRAIASIEGQLKASLSAGASTPEREPAKPAGKN